MPIGMSEEVMIGSAKFRSRESIVILPPRDTGDGYSSHWMVCVCLFPFLFFAYFLFICLFVCLFICLFV